jgi:calcineurin-like phosphoesterase family protein
MEKYHKSQFMKNINLTGGILDFNNALELYKKYLETPQLNWAKEMKRPVRGSIFKSMCKTHEDIGQDPIRLINQTVAAGGRLLFWSDLHFYHNNIIEYAERPFANTEQMNQQMLNNYWANVTDKDIVVFGGDIAYGPVEDTINLILDLPGKKVLVLGNHDFEKNKAFYRDYKVFDVVTMAFVMQRDIDGKVYNVLVTHYPIHREALPENTINIHGHTHNQEPGSKNINMSVEMVNFTPVSMEQAIEDLIKKFK